MQQPQWIPLRRLLPRNHDDDEFVAAHQMLPDCAPKRAGGVLIVEDDFLIAMQAEGALTDAGIIVVGIASTAEEAVLLARQHKPVLVVMDIRLAGQRDGIEAAEELFRELGIKCVFATAHGDQRTRSRAEPFAPLGWLTKPYTMESLIALVRQGIAGEV
jgi:two-component system, response regulator PdtaR